MSFTRGSEIKGSSFSSASGGDLPLLDCKYCGIPVVRLESKKPRSYGQIFYKCPNNDKDDPNSCPFFKWEHEYRTYLERQLKSQTCLERQFKNEAPFQKLQKEVMAAAGRPTDWSAEIVKMQYDIEELKLMMHDLKKIVSEQRAKKVIVVDSNYVLVACVCCMVGVFLAVMFNVNGK